MDLKQYLNRVTELISSDTPENVEELKLMEYNKDDKDSGFRSWFRYTGANFEEATERHSEIFEEVVYDSIKPTPKPSPKPLAPKEMQMQFSF